MGHESIQGGGGDIGPEEEYPIVLFRGLPVSSEPPRVKRRSVEVTRRAANTDDEEYNRLHNEYYGFVESEAVSKPLDEEPSAE